MQPQPLLCAVRLLKAVRQMAEHLIHALRLVLCQRNAAAAVGAEKAVQHLLRVDLLKECMQMPAVDHQLVAAIARNVRGHDGMQTIRIDEEHRAGQQRIRPIRNERASAAGEHLNDLIAVDVLMPVTQLAHIAPKPVAKVLQWRLHCTPSLTDHYIKKRQKSNMQKFFSND